VVYKSVDGGNNWSAIWRGDNLARYILIDPRDSNVIYVSTGIFDREAANSDHTTNSPGGVGVLKSTDGGQTWAQMNNGITNLYVGTLFMHPEDPDMLLAGTGNNAYPDGAGVFLTVDGGQTWEKVLDHGVQSVEFASSDTDIAYAGEPGWIFRSEDGGLNWQIVSGNEPGWGPPGVEAGFPIDFQVDPRDPDRLFANNYGGGNFLSEDGGRTWVVASAGYTGAQARAIAVAPDDPARVFVSARSGFFGSENGGATWTGLANPEAGGLEWNVVAIDPNDSSHILAANNWMAQIVESRDSARSWRLTGATLPLMQGWRVISFAPSDPMTVYAGSGAFFSAGGFDTNIAASGIFVSRDGGATWADANDNLTQDAHVSDLAIHPTDPQRVFAAVPTKGLLVTNDSGGSWTTLSGLPSGARLLSVDIHPSQPETLFVGMEFGGLYRSDDGGVSWVTVPAGIPPEGTVTSVVFDPADPNTLFISLIGSGVSYSGDGGGTWTVINNGLRTRAVNELALSSDGLHLYAATEGEGVFRLDLNSQPPEGVIEEIVVVPEPEGVEGATEPEEGVKPEESKEAEEPEEQEGSDGAGEVEGEVDRDEPDEDGGIPCLGGVLPLVMFGMIWVPRGWRKKPWGV
jgi:photosystem II stability/assembly factor-like uncharacterized protein